MKKIISIFLLPFEIDDFDYQLKLLEENFKRLERAEDWVIDVSLSISSDLIDWNKSRIPPDFFIDKLKNLIKRSQFCKINCRYTDKILGCVSARREAFSAYEDAGYFIWLDSDIVFCRDTLTAISQSIVEVEQKCKLAIITPEIVRIWDETWDCLVASPFRDKPPNYQRGNDPYIDCGIKGKLSLEPVHNNVSGQPRFKFAGGWFTCLSRELLELIPIPESFSPYGLEDTYIMWASELLVKGGKADIRQYKIKNLVVCENYKYRNNTHYTNHMTTIDRREQYLAQNRKVFNAELQNYLQ